VAAHFQSPPRKGEETIAVRLFTDMDYRVERPPATFEGEADLKHLCDNIYIGGYGQRTDPKSYDWFEKKFDMKVIRCKMDDEHLYHFDCMFFPLNSETALCCTSLLDKQEIKEIEKYCDLIPVSSKLAHAAITNCVRVGAFIICGSTLSDLHPGDKDYEDEHDKVAFMEKQLPKFGMEPILVNLSEFEKSGAAASCLVCHLNRASYSVPLM